MGMTTSRGGQLHSRTSRTVTDFESGLEVEVPCDPKLGLREQVEKHYSLARRKPGASKKLAPAWTASATQLAQADSGLANLPPTATGRRLSQPRQGSASPLPPRHHR